MNSRLPHCQCGTLPLSYSPLLPFMVFFCNFLHSFLHFLGYVTVLSALPGELHPYILENPLFIQFSRFLFFPSFFFLWGCTSDSTLLTALMPQKILRYLLYQNFKSLATLNLHGWFRCCNRPGLPFRHFLQN